MYIETPTRGYHFRPEDLKIISDKYGAKYLGYFQKKLPDGMGYRETPIDVWYQPNPDISKGHSHYFGMYIQDGRAWITDACRCFEEPIVGMLCDDYEEVIISRFRHDYVSKKGAMIDGGRAYTRSSIGTRVSCTIYAGEWVFGLAMRDWPESMGLAFNVTLTPEQAEDLRIQKEFLDPDNREWEYDATGVRVFKGTRTPFKGDLNGMD